MAIRHDPSESEADNATRNDHADRSQTRTATGTAALIAAIALGLAGITLAMFGQFPALGLVVVAFFVAWWARGRMRAIRNAPGD